MDSRTSLFVYVMHLSLYQHNEGQLFTLRCHDAFAVSVLVWNQKTLITVPSQYESHRRVPIIQRWYICSDSQPAIR